MNPLRQKLIDEIDLRGRSVHTRRAYVQCIARLAKFYQRSPDQLSDEEVRGYLLHLLRQEKLSASSLVVAVSALRFFYERVGLSNRRLRAVDPSAQTVTFEYKDYADESRKKLLTLDWETFLHRFRLHLLPARFVKIRHYGLLSNRNRHDRIATARAALHVAPLPATSPETAATPDISSHFGQACPHCQQPALRLIRVLRPPAAGARTKITDTS